MFFFFYKGEVFLHGYVGHSFGGDSGIRLSLNARARQFSSFLVLVGRISGPGQFDPQFGFICQNKDEFDIPLDLETIPTPKEFRDAIESLSPEQQQFCKLFRGMQLASTLFGVCVLQLKPQMERVLKLNDQALTKEIRLTQDLIDLFLQYQIPSDLLSFGGAAQVDGASKLQDVKRNVAAMQAMIQKAKDKEISDAALEAQMRVTESIAASAVPSPPVQYSMGGGGGRDGGPPPVKGPSPRRMMAPSAPRMAMSAPPPPAMSAPPPSAPVAVAASVPAPAAAPVTTSAPVEAPAAPADASNASTKFVATSEGDSDVDFTKLPGELDSKFEKYDADAALRPTILNVGKYWNKRSQKTLLSPMTQQGLPVAQQKLERNTCFDLIDAITNSGAISFQDATLHVVMARFSLVSCFFFNSPHFFVFCKNKKHALFR